ncbi:MAG: F0F1 ATP synthase subunit A [Thermoflexales bacterium]|nr:F0F1 ATP synthase subunit A [Thermoflexales bacterium]
MKGCLYIVIALLAVTALCGASSGFLTSLNVSTLLDGPLGEPALPTVSLPAERISGSVNILGFETGLTNTMVATILTDIILVAVAFFATRKIRSGSEQAWVPRGLQNVIEMIVETLYGFAEPVLHGRTAQVFWLGATIFFFVWIANWMELIPGVDAIGWVEKAHDATLTTYNKGEFLGLATVKGPAIPPKTSESPSTEEHAEPEGYILVPFVRAAATDLNVTLALALIAVVAVQVYGLQAQRAGYLSKFVNTRQLSQGKPMGLLDVFVGVLESISEVSKVISFAFRLFGNIFAGQVLLFVMGFLIPFLFAGILIFWGLEIFVGLIQAFVFMMLTFVFIAQATAGHGEAH